MHCFFFVRAGKQTEKEKEKESPALSPSRLHSPHALHLVRDNLLGSLGGGEARLVARQTW